jgi:hypothetical protein
MEEEYGSGYNMGSIECEWSDSEITPRRREGILRSAGEQRSTTDAIGTLGVIDASVIPVEYELLHVNVVIKTEKSCLITVFSFDMSHNAPLNRSVSFQNYTSYSLKYQCLSHLMMNRNNGLDTCPFIY